MNFTIILLYQKIFNQFKHNALTYINEKVTDENFKLVFKDPKVMNSILHEKDFNIEQASEMFYTYVVNDMT